MLNKIAIMGRLVQDPEIRTTGNQKIPVTTITIACDRDYKNSAGEVETDFIDVVAWRSTADFIGQYFTKGQMIAVEGRLQIRTWEDDDKNKHRVAEIVADHVYFAGSKPEKQDEKPRYNKYNKR